MKGYPDDLPPLGVTDLPLFHNGTPTSVKAAQEIDPHRPTQRQRILHALDECGPLTRAELVARTGLKENAVNPRCAELLLLRKLKPCGERDGREVLGLA